MREDKILCHSDYHCDLDTFVQSLRRGLGRQGPVGVASNDVQPVKAEINHGRWIAHCPNCTGAEMVDPADPRFFCLSCGNASAGGAWLPVEFPAKRVEIEAAVLKRPKIENRNWSQGESLAKLRRENRVNGVV